MRAQALKVGDGLESRHRNGAVHQRAAAANGDEVRRRSARTKAQNSPRAASDSKAAATRNGWFHEPTVFIDCDPKMRICQEEIFGPVVSVIPFETFDDALDIANDVKYGLSSSIYTRNVNNAFRAQRDLETGIVYVNAPTIGAETHLPFGGIKNTGNGHRESGMAALDFYSEWKTLYIDYSDRLQRAQIDNAD